MDRSSLKGNQAERDRRKKTTDAATRKLSGTEAGGVKLADQVGPIETKLTDINEELRAAKGSILDSIQKAGNEDAALLKKEEQGVREHQSVVQDLEQDTASEQHKADAIRTPDSRMKDGSELGRKLADAVRGLGELKRDLASTASDAEARRNKSVATIQSATNRNRR